MTTPRLPLGNPPPNPYLFKTPAEKAQRVADNLVRQYDEMSRLIVQSAGKLNVTPDLLKSLQRIAIGGIYACAGEFRTWPVYIRNVTHQPPPWDQVPALIDQMCAYANGTGGTAIHAAAYVMWRLNWIHPFGGGNGRTSRAVSYLTLCVRVGGILLPGRPTIPEQIVANRPPYYAALRHADDAWAQGRLDVSELEKLLSAMLASQLVSLYKAAGGTPLPAAPAATPIP